MINWIRLSVYPSIGNCGGGGAGAWRIRERGEWREWGMMVS